MIEQLICFKVLNEVLNWIIWIQLMYLKPTKHFFFLPWKYPFKGFKPNSSLKKGCSDDIWFLMFSPQQIS